MACGNTVLTVFYCTAFDAIFQCICYMFYFCTNCMCLCLCKEIMCCKICSFFSSETVILNHIS